MPSVEVIGRTPPPRGSGQREHAVERLPRLILLQLAGLATVFAWLPVRLRRHNFCLPHSDWITNRRFHVDSGRLLSPWGSATTRRPVKSRGCHGTFVAAEASNTWRRSGAT